eukprot:965050-Alexandrium_andersonii.AAC.1
MRTTGGRRTTNIAPIARGAPCSMEPGEASGASRAISPPISTTRRSSVQSWRMPSATSTGTPNSTQMSKTKSG